MTKGDAKASADIDVAANLAAVKSAIAKARADAGLPEAGTEIVAVSKKHGADRIRPALETGHRAFGENRVQEAVAKWPRLKDAHAGIELHLVGSLQSNKAEDAVALFDVIQSLDRPKLARKLGEAMDKTGRRPRLFIQVNTGEEPQKGGVALDDLPALVTLVRDELQLPLAGLMCLPPVDDAPALHFALLKKLAARHGLGALSMGMSADFESAAALDADYVRIGTAIFGERPDQT